MNNLFPFPSSLIPSSSAHNGSAFFAHLHNLPGDLLRFGPGAIRRERSIRRSATTSLREIAERGRSASPDCTVAHDSARRRVLAANQRHPCDEEVRGKFEGRNIHLMAREITTGRDECYVRRVVMSPEMSRRQRRICSSRLILFLEANQMTLVVERHNKVSEECGANVGVPCRI